MDEKKILIVDDEEVIRDLMKKIFTMAGYTVRVAEHAEKALDILKKESIMVMFLDLNLVGGTNGIDLCKKIRKDNYVGIIYALTGYTDLFSLLACRSSGFDDFFTKPIDRKLLIEAAEDGFKKIERWKVNDFNLD